MWTNGARLAWAKAALIAISAAAMMLGAGLCIGIGGVRVDRAVALQMLEAISNRAVEAAIFASDQVERSQIDGQPESAVVPHMLQDQDGSCGFLSCAGVTTTAPPAEDGHINRPRLAYSDMIWRTATCRARRARES
jgi:hypothetical protein